MLMADTIRSFVKEDISVRLKSRTPTPSRKPVTTLTGLLLSLRPTFCVVQSTIAGRANMRAVINPVWNGMATLNEDIKRTVNKLLEQINPKTTPEHRAQSRSSLPKARIENQWL
jgi:hypothetical protein